MLSETPLNVTNLYRYLWHITITHNLYDEVNFEDKENNFMLKM